MSAEHASPQRPDRQPSRPTQGKEAGKAPYQSEDLLREIVEQATDLIALTDAQGVITFASSASRSLFQCAPEEMYGRHFTEFLEESAVPTALAAFRGGRKRGPMVTGLGLTMKRKDGSTFFGELNASPLAVGEQKGSLVFIRDITERVRAKEMLRESETRARAMLSAIPDLMFRSDSHGVLLDYKGPMSDLYVQSDQTITGKRLLDIMPPEFADLVDLQIRDTLESGTLQVFEYQLPIPGRGMRDYEARMVASGADEVMTIVRDITERKQAAESLQKLTQKDEEALSIARMGHWELDMTTAQFTFNDQYYSLHGTTAEEAGGYVMSVERFRSRYVHPDDAALIGEAIRRISETNDPNVQLQQEARILRADGEVRDIDVWLRGEKDSQGRITKIRGVNQDVTERKRGETELVIANKELLFENEEKEKRAAELVLANDETVRRLQDIQALHKIDQAIAGSLDLNLTLNVVLEQVKTRLNIDAAAVLLLNRHTQMLEFTSGLGFRSKAIERSRLRLGEGQS